MIKSVWGSAGHAHFRQAPWVVPVMARCGKPCPCGQSRAGDGSMSQQQRWQKSPPSWLSRCVSVWYRCREEGWGGPSTEGRPCPCNQPLVSPSREDLPPVETSGEIQVKPDQDIDTELCAFHLVYHLVCFPWVVGIVGPPLSSTLHPERAAALPGATQQAGRLARRTRTRPQGLPTVSPPPLRPTTEKAA